jgi:hypothetical protein
MKRSGEEHCERQTRRGRVELDGMWGRRWAEERKKKGGGKEVW